jgi:hypothetical protein
VSRFELNILEFNGDLEPEEFLDWVLAVEEVLEFNGVLDERRVSINTPSSRVLGFSKITVGHTKNKYSSIVRIVLQ